MAEAQLFVTCAQKMAFNFFTTSFRRFLSLCYPLSVFSDKCWNSCFCIWILNSLQRGNLFAMEGTRFAFTGHSCPRINLFLFPEDGVMSLNLTWLPGKQRLWGKGQLELCLHRDANEDLSAWFSSPATPAFCKTVLSKYVLEENAWIRANLCLYFPHLQLILRGMALWLQEPMELMPSHLSWVQTLGTWSIIAWQAVLVLPPKHNMTVWGELR